MKAATVAWMTSLGFATGAHAQLLNPLRIVQWEMPVAKFQPDSVTSPLRSMRLDEKYALPLPRYLELRNDLIRITTTTGSAWYLIPLSPEIPYCAQDDCGAVDRQAR